MKRYFLLLLASLVALGAEPTGTPPAAHAKPSDTYAEFLKQLWTKEQLADFARVADKLIDAVDGKDGGRSSPQRVRTHSGLEIEFGLVSAPEAVLYHVSLRREGLAELHYSDATKLLAFFCDRAGLTHPLTVQEGERPVFYTQWLIKPSELKKMRKMMLKVREENRAEADVFRAFAVAIERELAARQQPKKRVDE